VADLRPADIEVVFREFLGRAATPGDVAVWMHASSLRDFFDGVLASEEYAQRVGKRSAGEAAQARGPFLNCWIAGWDRFARPPGEVSPDGAVIVGESGHMFIYGGTNDNVATQRGEIQMAAGWMKEWQELVNERRAHSKRAGRRLACLVVPEKLAVYSDRFPQDLTTRGPRPVVRLLDEAGLSLIYPARELRDARANGDTFLLTDSHLTVRGNRLLAEATMRELGVSPTLLQAIDHSTRPHLSVGDLGGHFDPPVVEIMHQMAAVSLATVVSDNWTEVSNVGGHIGAKRVFRHDAAPDKRTVVIFGDSYGFGDNAYQGLSWYLAQFFREVHFIWAPFGWDPEYLDSVGAGFVVCQTAERFIGRVPRASIDVRSLAQETIAERRAVTEQRIFR
jgi:hypothetical protein